MSPDPVRVTAWVSFGHHGKSHYRIWMRQTPFGFYQAHEWRDDDGSTSLDGWIPTSARQFPANTTVAADPTPSTTDALRAALEQIASGHNDPRSLARETLDRLKDAA